MKAEREVLVDSGATDNFISEKLLKRMKIGKIPLKKPRYIWNIVMIQTLRVMGLVSLQYVFFECSPCAASVRVPPQLSYL